MEFIGRVSSRTPAPDGAVFVIGGGIFSVGLVGHDFVIGDSVGARTAHLAKEKACESRLQLNGALLFVVHVEKIEFSGSVRKSACNMLEQSAHRRFTEGVEEEGETGSLGEFELHSIGAADLHRSAGAPGGSPFCEVPLGDSDETGVEFDSLHLQVWITGREQHGSAHPSTDIDEGEAADRGARPGPLPALVERMKNGRRDAKVGG